MRYILLVFVLLFGSINVTASTLPKKADRAFVVDMACKEEKVCILSKVANDSWTAHAVDLQKRTGVQVVLIVVHGTENVSFEQYANDAANTLKVGTRGNGGVVFLFDNKEHKARLEVSRDLEGVIPDLTAKKVVELFSKTLRSSVDDSSGDQLTKSLSAVFDSVDGYVTENKTQKGGKAFVAEKDKSFTYFAIICCVIILICSFVAVLLYSKRWYYTGGSLLSGVLCVIMTFFFPTITVSLFGTFVFAFIATFIFAWIWHRAGDSAGWDILDSISPDGVSQVTGSMAQGVADFAGGGATEIVGTTVEVMKSASGSCDPGDCNLDGCDPSGCDLSGCDIGGCDL